MSHGYIDTQSLISSKMGGAVKSNVDLTVIIFFVVVLLAILWVLSKSCDALNWRRFATAETFDMATNQQKKIYYNTIQDGITDAQAPYSNNLYGYDQVTIKNP